MPTAARASILAALAALATDAARGGDWPQILGPTRSGVAAADERLAASWPAAGPHRAWRRGVGSGVAGLAVVGDRGFLFHRLGDREVLEAIDTATSETVWSDGHRTTFVPQVGGGNGPLCIPVVAGGRVVVFGSQGMLACIDAATGRRLWQRATHREFDANEGYFGAGSTPLVVDTTVIVNLGGRRGAGLVAFDLGTGETAWAATDEGASYAAPVAVEAAGGRTHALVVTRLSCLLLDASDGRVRWSFPFGQRGPTVNAACPVPLGPGRFLVTAAYGVGSVCATYDADAATEVWGGTGSLSSQYATPVLVDGVLYAVDGRDDVPPADLVCLDPADGRVRWRERGFGYGTLLAADGRILAVMTDGELLLLRPDAERLDVVARARPFADDPDGGPVRALPALSGGRLYLRNDRWLVALQVGP